MAINALRRPASSADGPEGMPLAIGEPDSAIFVCTSCARPLASGARRCPSCGARFLLDAPLGRAGALVAFGLAAGLILGAGSVGVLALAAAKPIDAAPVASAPAGPLATNPAAAPTAAPAVPAVPPAAVAALRGTATIDARIAEVAAPLAAEVASTRFDAPNVARLLRRLSVEAGAGQTLLPALATWPEATDHAAALGTFYEELAVAVREGLDASIRNEQAYRATATRVLTLLDGLGALDEAGRTLAEDADITLATP